MSAITTHVLDTARGEPAQGVPVTLEFLSGDGSGDGTWTKKGEGKTGADGRCPDLLPEGAALEAGAYRLTFNTGAYFSLTLLQGTQGFYPQVTVEFTVKETAQHYHVPLLLSPFGYSTYRGS